MSHPPRPKPWWVRKVQVSDVGSGQIALYDGLGSGVGDIVAPGEASGAPEMPPSGAWRFFRGDVNWPSWPCPFPWPFRSPWPLLSLSLSSLLPVSSPLPSPLPSPLRSSGPDLASPRVSAPDRTPLQYFHTREVPPAAPSRERLRVGSRFLPSRRSRQAEADPHQSLRDPAPGPSEPVPGAAPVSAPAGSRAPAPPEGELSGGGARGGAEGETNGRSGVATADTDARGSGSPSPK